jgi:hypothetical protein
VNLKPVPLRGTGPGPDSVDARHVPNRDGVGVANCSLTLGSAHTDVLRTRLFVVALKCDDYNTVAALPSDLGSTSPRMVSSPNHAGFLFESDCGIGRIQVLPERSFLSPLGCLTPSGAFLWVVEFHSEHEPHARAGRRRQRCAAGIDWCAA